MGEILDFTFWSINIDSNRSSTRILYCPPKSQLKYIQWSTTMIESFKPQGIYHLNTQESSSSLKASTSSTDNFRTREQNEIPNSQRTEISKVVFPRQQQVQYCNWVFSAAHLLPVFDKKGTRVCRQKKSRALGDEHTMKFLQTLHQPTPFSRAAFEHFPGDTVPPFRINPKHTLA